MNSSVFRAGGSQSWFTFCQFLFRGESWNPCQHTFGHKAQSHAFLKHLAIVWHAACSKKKRDALVWSHQCRYSPLHSADFLAQFWLTFVQIRNTCRRTHSTTAEICNFGETSPLDFFYFLRWMFFLFLRVCVCVCKLAMKSTKNVEKIWFPGGEKRAESRHVSGCHGFFGPDYLKSPNSEETSVKNLREHLHKISAP